MYCTHSFSCYIVISRAYYTLYTRRDGRCNRCRCCCNDCPNGCAVFDATILIVVVTVTININIYDVYGCNWLTLTQSVKRLHVLHGAIVAEMVAEIVAATIAKCV